MSWIRKIPARVEGLNHNPDFASKTVFRPNPHWTRARKFEHKSFDVACVQCGLGLNTVLEAKSGL